MTVPTSHAKADDAATAVVVTASGTEAVAAGPTLASRPGALRRGWLALLQQEDLNFLLTN
ncbi:MAG: hypothetical protein RL722_2324, partial [Pseudomonadota bacterium]